MTEIGRNTEFNLSEERYSWANGIFIHEDRIKEFIKRLKEQLAESYKMSREGSINYYAFDEFIDKLAGKELVE